MTPPETITIAPTGGSFTISPVVELAATITDTAASGSGWTAELSYDGGSSWVTLTGAATLGVNDFGPTTALPSLTTGTACQLRVTNNTTLDTATSSTFPIQGDQVEMFSRGLQDPNTIRIGFRYATDTADATPTPSPPTDITINADTSGGAEMPDSQSAPDPTDVDYHFNDVLMPGGMFNVVADGTETWDRPFSSLMVPQTIVI